MRRPLWAFCVGLVVCCATLHQLWASGAVLPLSGMEQQDDYDQALTVPCLQGEASGDAPSAPRRPDVNSVNTSEATPANATTLPATLYMDPMLDQRHPCCAHPSLFYHVHRMMPSDISELLPMLELYVRDAQVETIVEAGSRLGVSTTTLLRSIRSNRSKMAATMDLNVSAIVDVLYKCEAKCGEPGRTLFTVEGSDLVTPIPFVDVHPRPDKGPRPIDLFFIDTLHNGAQLYMELLRFAPHVKQRLLFHDISSFYSDDEAPSIVPPAFTRLQVPRPMGLHAAIQMFLNSTEEGKLWEEEVAYRHNNGLFCLRRKDWPLSPGSLVTEEKSSGNATGDVERFQDLEGAFSPAFKTAYANLKALCHRFQLMRNHSFWTTCVGNVTLQSLSSHPPNRTDNGTRKHDSLSHRVLRYCSRRKLRTMAPFHRTMTQPPFPLHSTLAVVHGLVKSMHLVALLEAKGRWVVRVFCGGCHAVVFTIVAAETRMLTHAGSFAVTEPPPQLNGRFALAVLSSLWVNRNFGSYAAFEQAVLRMVTHRVVVYGCAVVPLRAELLTPALRGSPPAFALRSVHELDAGILFLERPEATDFHYVQHEGKVATEPQQQQAAN